MTAVFDPALLEKVALAINGPFKEVPSSSPYTLAEVRRVRWTNTDKATRAERIQSAHAALSEVLKVLQEPLTVVGPVKGPLGIQRTREALLRKLLAPETAT